MDKILVTNIQRFSIHDGPGIRTTVFVKGCPLRCPWCSNPENMEGVVQKYVRNGIEGVYGKYYSVEEIYDEIIKDKCFYSGELTEYHISSADCLDKLPGGVTFSGGECLLYAKQLEPLLCRLKEEHIHTTVETSLFVPEANLDMVVEYIDLFYVDVKILDKELCKKYLGGEIDLYLRNLDALMKAGRPIVFRVPVIGGYTDSSDNRKKIKELVEQYKNSILKVELLKGHNLGESKYKTLIDAGYRDYILPQYEEISDDLFEQYRSDIERIGVRSEVCRI